ncbi:MAG: hypothetical protein GF331_02235, partial [Chitinivibrionales bacterium]|nr:hypothetical protein [Chitinivibrionales bacterium]
MVGPLGIVAVTEVHHPVVALVGIVHADLDVRIVVHPHAVAVVRTHAGPAPALVGGEIAGGQIEHPAIAPRVRPRGLFSVGGDLKPDGGMSPVVGAEPDFAGDNPLADRGIVDLVAHDTTFGGHECRAHVDPLGPGARVPPDIAGIPAADLAVTAAVPVHDPAGLVVAAAVHHPPPPMCEQRLAVGAAAQDCDFGVLVGVESLELVPRLCVPRIGAAGHAVPDDSGTLPAGQGEDVTGDGGRGRCLEECDSAQECGQRGYGTMCGIVHDFPLSLWHRTEPTPCHIAYLPRGKGACTDIASVCTIVKWTRGGAAATGKAVEALAPSQSIAAARYEPLGRVRRHRDRPGELFCPSSSAVSLTPEPSVPYPAVRFRSRWFARLLIAVPAGGVVHAVAAAEAPPVGTYLLWNRASYAFLAGALLVAGITNLTFFLLRRKERACGYLSAICLAFAVNVLLPNTSRLPLRRLLPWLTDTFSIRLDLFTLSIAIGSSWFLTRELFPRDVPLRLVKVAAWLSAVVAGAALTTPFPVVDIAYRLYLAMIGLYCMYCAYIAVRALVLKRPDARPAAVGICIIALAGGIDVLSVLQVVRPLPLFISTALLIFTCILSYIVARRFTSAYAASEQLSRELKEANTALSRMDAVKDQFLANTSHELRTPLTGIIGIAESLPDTYPETPEEVRRNLGTIAASGRRLSALVNDILDFSRLKNRDIRLDTRAVHLAPVVRTVATVLAPLVRDKPVALRIDKDAVDRWVMADEDRLQQVLYNLI